MKKLTMGIMIAFLSLSFVPTQLRAGTDTTPISLAVTNTTETTEADALVARLTAINAMDKTNLNFGEKKQLRVEVRAIKSHLQHLSGGVYLSAGTIILILILLIIFL